LCAHTMRKIVYTILFFHLFPVRIVGFLFFLRSLDKLLCFGNKNKLVFILYGAQLFVTLDKLLCLGNKNKLVFILYCAQLFVTLRQK